MVIKLVKWAFDLGYKTAELKYYHALQQQISIPLESQLAVQRIEDHLTETEQRELLLKRMEVDQKLTTIINKVFKPFRFEHKVPVEIFKFSPTRDEYEI